MSKIYLACQYSTANDELKTWLVKECSMIAAKLMEAGHVVYSPITHSHVIRRYLSDGNRNSFEFWRKQSIAMLEDSDILVILPFLGWRSSRGIAREMDFAKFEGIPIFIYNLATGILVPHEEVKAK